MSQKHPLHTGIAGMNEPTELERRLAQSRGGLEIELGKLSPVAGDVVIMRVHPDTSTKMITDMLGHMKQQLPEGVKLIGLFEGVDIEHLTTDDMAKLGWVHRDAVPGLQEEIAAINQHIREEATGMDGLLTALEGFRDHVADSGECDWAATLVGQLIARYRNPSADQSPAEPGDQQYLTPGELTEEQVAEIVGAKVGDHAVSVTQNGPNTYRHRVTPAAAAGEFKGDGEVGK